MIRLELRVGSGPAEIVTVLEVEDSIPPVYAEPWIRAWAAANTAALECPVALVEGGGRVAPEESDRDPDA